MTTDCSYTTDLYNERNDLTDECNRLRTINADLLAALKLMLAVYGWTPGEKTSVPCSPEAADREARNAIDAAEGL